MPLGGYPKDPLLDNKGMLVRVWDNWVSRLQNIVDFGNPPSADTDISATTGIQKTNDLMRIQSATAGNTTITANPQITPGTYDGERLGVEGLDNVKTVTMNNGNGVELKTASVVFNKNLIIEFLWNDAQKLWIKIQ